MFSLILRCLDQQFCTPKDTELLANLLYSLSRLSRFSIISLFMDSKDKKGNVKNNDITVAFTIVIFYQIKHETIYFYESSWLNSYFWINF